jgi:hypothetical protein
MKETILSATVPESLRLLEWNELVRRGDFVEDGRGGFEPWDGPSGFRADAFIKQIYRRQDGLLAGTLKQS